MSTPSNHTDDFKLVPKMNIAILVVGTYGDVLPFLAIGKRLQADGHRVRLATHSNYRSLVTETHGLEYYPLAGDPKALAAYMVQTNGQLIPSSYNAIAYQIPKYMNMIEQILHSTWGAVSSPDPLDDTKSPFVANAIISNPVTYGHIHVAERLGVPLTIMFPQPWNIPTREFPHPMSNLRYCRKAHWRYAMSYKAVDALMWKSMQGMVNRFRVSVLGLRKLRTGDAGHKLLRKVPHVFMWSPLLLPKPQDWGNHVEVVGQVELASQNHSVVEKAPTPPEGVPTALIEFFESKSKNPIVFCGFGSMVMNSEEAANLMKWVTTAAERANARLIIQSSWTEWATTSDSSSDTCIVPSCPHDWLFPQVDAVIHHGGAGTTMAGLRAGKPTLVLPFFGDQHLWGHVVASHQLGPEPIPFRKVNEENLTAAVAQLVDADCASRARNFGERMKSECGREEAVAAFYRHLPVADMVCDIDRRQLATCWLVNDGLKVCDEVAALVLGEVSLNGRIKPYEAVHHAARGPIGTVQGIRSGARNFVHEFTGAIKDLVVAPISGYYCAKPSVQDKVRGIGSGVVKGVSGLIIRPVRGLGLWADKIMTGHHNRNPGQAVTPSYWQQSGCGVYTIEDEEVTTKRIQELSSSQSSSSYRRVRSTSDASSLKNASSRKKTTKIRRNRSASVAAHSLSPSQGSKRTVLTMEGRSASVQEWQATCRARYYRLTFPKQNFI